MSTKLLILGLSVMIPIVYLRGIYVGKNNIRTPAIVQYLAVSLLGLFLLGVFLLLLWLFSGLYLEPHLDLPDERRQLIDFSVSISRSEMSREQRFQRASDWLGK